MREDVSPIGQQDERVRRLSEEREARRLRRLTPFDLSVMPNSHFRGVVINVFGNRLISPLSREGLRIQNALEDRMWEGKVHFKDIYDVLFTFDIPDDHGDKDELQKAAIASLYKHPQLADPVFAANQRARSRHEETERKITIKNAFTQVDGDEVFDVVMIVEGRGGMVISEAFRAVDRERSVSLARANILSKVVGIPVVWILNLLKKQE